MDQTCNVAGKGPLTKWADWLNMVWCVCCWFEDGWLAPWLVLPSASLAYHIHEIYYVRKFYIGIGARIFIILLSLISTLDLTLPVLEIAAGLMPNFWHSSDLSESSVSSWLFKELQKLQLACYSSECQELLDINKTYYQEYQASCDLFLFYAGNEK